MNLKSDPAKLLKSHAALIQSDNRKVLSHTQREKDGWYLNSIMIEGCQTPFKFKRKQAYKPIGKGQRVNLTYYPMTEEVAGLQFEVMKVVRIKLS